MMGHLLVGVRMRMEMHHILSWLLPEQIQDSRSVPQLVELTCTHLRMLLRMSLTGKRWLLMAKGSGEFTEFKEFKEWRSRQAPDKARTLGDFGDSDLVGIGEMDWTGLERQGAGGPYAASVASPCRALHRGAIKRSQRQYLLVVGSLGEWGCVELDVDDVGKP